MAEGTLNSSLNLFLTSFSSSNLCLGARLQIVGLKGVLPPPSLRNFRDVYVAFELMDSDLFHLLASEEPLSESHCQVSRFWHLASNPSFCTFTFFLASSVISSPL
jgi:hypothetical protein